MIDTASLPRRAINWSKAVRIIPSRFPPVGLFDRVAEPTDLDTVFAIEGMTNARLREARGEQHVVSPEDRVSGPGMTPVMAAFTHPHPLGRRFSTASWGVYVAARTLNTAIRETVHSREQFLRACRSPPEELDMRVYYAATRGKFCDLRNSKRRLPFLYRLDPSADAETRHLAEVLRAAGDDGLLYDSLRDPGGACIAVFRPRVIKSCRQGEHFVYRWDGQEIALVYRKEPYRAAG